MRYTSAALCTGSFALVEWNNKAVTINAFHVSNKIMDLNEIETFSFPEAMYSSPEKAPLNIFDQAV